MIVLSTKEKDRLISILDKTKHVTFSDEPNPPMAVWFLKTEHCWYIIQLLFQQNAHVFYY
jgi:hypothetical protein